MVFIRKSIDIISPSDGKRYTSITQYEKSLHSRGQDIMSEKRFHELRDQLRDTEKAPPPKRDETNHIHIDFNNGTVEKSKRDLNDR
jgi:hypothetical protein